MKFYKPMVVLFIQIFLFLFNASTGDATCQFDGCYADSQKKIPRPCMAAPVSVAFKRNITATNTCGKPKGTFCELPVGGQCFECDANSTTKRHPPEFMVNSEFDSPYSPKQEQTWWQSQTWWETYTQGLTTANEPLKVNITLSFGRSFHISGSIIIRFYNERPKKMFLETSKDFGKTWSVLQYFALDCPRSYNMPATAPVVQNNPFNTSCTKDFSGQVPQRYGIVEFRFDSRYEPGCGYFDRDMQNFMLATNVRVRLEKPAIDGIGTSHASEEFLSKYYYAISDIVITGRCNCNGHAQYCTGPRMKEMCECEHNTAGDDCEICKPMFNNRPWMPANSSHANECQECQCNNHGVSCAYNGTLGLGVCTSCQHNTEGEHCEKCQPKFFRDTSVSLDHPNTCIACNCFPEGITNDGSCHQEATPTAEAGQCHCKNKVFGRQCDQCIPGYWGYRLDPLGECTACRCNNLGTVNNTIQCDQYNGTCPCMTSIQGRYCDKCKDGFYFFPIAEASNCLRCPCDFGGAYPRCHNETGTCSCRVGVEGSWCKRTEQGHFFPALDFIRFEVEDMNGTFTITNPSEGRGTAFTGSGYALPLPGHYAHTNGDILASHKYYVVIRYSITESCAFSPAAKLVFSVKSTGLNDSVDFNILLKQLPQGSGQAWRSRDSLQLLSGEVYNFTLLYSSAGGSDNCSLLVDSLVFIPDVNLTRVYTESGADTQNQLQSCVQAKMSLSQAQSEPAYCQALVFSASTEIYNGTLVCGCDPVGSVPGSQCATYGGQCHCRPGVVGRTCHACDIGFYGFSAAGCKRCQCSSAGSLSSTCHMTTGECRCKDNVHGRNCDSCKAGTFNLDGVNQQGCLHCFGHGRAISCISANGFAASTITSQFINETVFNWTVVNSAGVVDSFAGSASNGLVVTSTSSVFFIQAPSLFLGTQFRSYGQRLHVKMEIRGLMNGHDPPGGSDHVILLSGAREVALNFIPSPSPNVTSYHVILDETHVVGGPSVSPLEFQSILAELTSLKIRATYYPQGSVTFKNITMETAVRAQGESGEVEVGFVENATCHVNYTGLSCEQCAQGYTREVNGSGPFGRCVLCSCNNRSRQCDGETGACTNCQVGTYGDRCELCTNNVQGPECIQCKPGYWGLSENGCKACNCYTLGTASGNDTVCDQVTGQCMCNATANIGGRRCDKCMENSWNSSAGVCQECPHCYSSIQDDMNLLRAKVSSMAVHLSTLKNHPAMLHNHTFVERVRQLVAEVSRLAQTINAAQEADRNSTSQWMRFAFAVNDLSARLNETTESAVNQTLHFTTIVNANWRETETTVTQIHDVVSEAARLLGTPIRLEVEQAEVVSSSIARVAGQLVDVTHSITREKNRTLSANQTVYSRVEYAAETVNIATETARNVTDTQDQVAALLWPLDDNATAVKALGDQTVAIVSDKLTRANRAYNDSLKVLNQASLANPDRSSVLQDLKRETADARNLTAQYRNQVSGLYQSSTAVISQVNAALERTVVLHNDVQAVVLNATQGHQDSQAVQTAAREAVAKANSVYSQAQKMLNVARNFETESRRAQASANKSLLNVAWIQNTTHQIIKNVSTVNESTSSTLSMAAEALRLGNMIQNLSITEQQVVEKAHRLAKKLRNETSMEKVVINNTVENFHAREIEPVQKLCQNLSTRASHMSNNSAALLTRAAHANTTAQRLSILMKRLHNESTGLPRVNVDNLSTLRGNVSSARRQFGGLQLGPQIMELKRQLQLQKEKMGLYKARIRKLRSDIDGKKNLLRSMPSVSPC